MDIFGMDSDCAGAGLDGAIQSRYEYTWADGGRAVPGVRRFFYLRRKAEQAVVSVLYKAHNPSGVLQCGSGSDLSGALCIR